MAAAMAATTTRTRGFLFTSKLPYYLQRETVQERQPTRDQGKPTQHQQHTQSDKQSSAGHFEGVHMELEAVIELEKASDSKRRQQERNCKPARVKGYKKNA